MIAVLYVGDLGIIFIPIESIQSMYSLETNRVYILSFYNILDILFRLKHSLHVS